MLEGLKYYLFGTKLKEEDLSQLTLDERLKTEFILRSNQGSLFQIIVCSVLLIFAAFNGESGEICRIAIICAMIFQAIRLHMFSQRKSNIEKLLKKLRVFFFLSLLTQASWAISCFASLLQTGPIGLGLAITFMCVGVISALSYSCAPLQFERLVLTLVVAVPVFFGLVAVNAYFSTFFFLVHLGYSLFIGDRQHSALKLILEQQKRIVDQNTRILAQQNRIQEDLVAAKNIQQSLLPPRCQRF